MRWIWLSILDLRNFNFCLRSCTFDTSNIDRFLILLLVWILKFWNLQIHISFIRSILNQSSITFVKTTAVSHWVVMLLLVSTSSGFVWRWSDRLVEWSVVLHLYLQSSLKTTKLLRNSWVGSLVKNLALWHRFFP